MSTVMHRGLAEQFASRMDAADVVTDPAEVDAYLHDAAPFSPAGEPVALVFPRGAAEVRHVMRTAFRLGVPVVPQGGRTGLSGAANAIDGCVLLSMTKMDRIVDIDAANRLVRCQPGVTVRALRDAVALHGLSYPPDPLSDDACTVGGAIATNAAGACCAKYGDTARYVAGLAVVLSDGRLARLGGTGGARATGYGLTRLFVGSEGTLGVTVEATLSLRPRQTEPLALLAQFDSAAAAQTAASAVIAAGHAPCALELMDPAATAAVAELGHPDIAIAGATTLVAESDGADREQVTGDMGRLCESAGARHVATSHSEPTARRLFKARRMVAEALRAKASGMRGRGASFVADVAVPPARLAELVDRIAGIAATHAIAIATVAHAADGVAHPTLVFDADDPDAHERAWHAYDAVLDAALSLDGAMTGGHGVGLLKREWLARELDRTALELHREIKDLLDPTGILNPGKVL